MGAGYNKDWMTGDVEKCAHLEGLQPTSGTGFWCPVCGTALGVGAVERWVREAEEARDRAYLSLEGDEFGRVLREERQREVYRRRRLLYELREVPPVASKPEMILAVYDGRAGCYKCRVFYKEPKPTWCVERVVVGASRGEIQKLKAHSDPVVRLVAEKVWEFRQGRRVSAGADGPARRVFYADEL